MLTYLVSGPSRKLCSAKDPEIVLQRNKFWVTTLSYIIILADFTNRLPIMEISV